jgi:myo-inositol-1(or 4)-monophosphatase
MLLAHAIEAAQMAGTILKEQFGQTVQVNEATQHDLKIQADIDSQKRIETFLLSKHPSSCLLGEEGNAGTAGAELEWIVDPIDGTVNYAMGFPHFCVSIAARFQGELVVGVVYDPMRNELFSTEKGSPSYLNGKVIRVSSRASLGEAMLAVGFAKSEESVHHCLELYGHYAPRARKMRAMGSAALDLAYVAAGRLDAYIEQGVSLWDIAAGVLLVENAGGIAEHTLKADGKSYKVCARSGKIEFDRR